MNRYIAFLRGVNVSGQKIIKMETLRKVISDAGFTDVKTYIQSGNILFYSETTDLILIIQEIENQIRKIFGFQTDVILRKYADVKSIAESIGYSQIRSDEVNKFYITFLKEEYPEQLSLPLLSKNQDVEIIYQHKMELISISKPYKGIYGFPNSFVEKLTGIPATTRNPNTLEKILKL